MPFKDCDQAARVLFPPAIGDLVPEDHLVRVVSEVIDQLDIGDITRKYSRIGQRAYHPVVLLKVLFYGYATGVRSSRQIADAIQFNVAFIWLAAGNRPDFRTIADFRKDHFEAIENLFVQIVRICHEMGMVKVGNWSVDGTHIKASANIGKSNTRETIDARIAALRREIADDLAEAGRVDEAEDELHGRTKTATELPRKLRNKRDRLARLERAKRKLEEYPQRNKANTTDPDAALMKKGKRAAQPAYNAQATVDTDSGVIVAVAVGDNSADNAQLVSQVDQATANVGQAPERICADAGYTSGPNLEAMEERGIDAYIPQGENRDARHLLQVASDNPSMAVVMMLALANYFVEAMGKTLDDIPFGRQDFTYDADADSYRCPAGETLKLYETTRKTTACGDYEVKRYVRNTKDCAGCPFAGRCLKDGAKTRTIKRSEHEERAQAMTARLRTPEGRAIYGKRKCSVEPVFGVLKQVMHFREFLLRGIEQVGAGFALAAGAFNLRKIFSHRQQQQQQAVPATP